ncbi:MAG: helix-turn-helix transcriptional regulator [Clostridia bacterium]|nr:helix-turn-helix transcriptional regulator [Clostridia bacterium]
MAEEKKDLGSTAKIVVRFAENLRILRKSAGLSQKRLAEELGVDQRTVSAWENGICEPSYALLAQLCEIFDESFDGILT